MRNRRQSLSSLKAFTLFEMVIVMAIAGIIMTTVMTAYNQYNRDKRNTETFEKLQTIHTALSSFSSAQAAEGERYPCPAPIKYPLTHEKAGYEDCTLSAAAIGTCDPDTGICKVRGRATDLFPAGGGVLIGAVPFKTLKEKKEVIACFNPSDPTETVPCSTPGVTPEEVCYTEDRAQISCSAPGARQRNESSFTDISSNDVVDAWGHQMTYAVTELLTNSSTYDATYGAISLDTEDGVSLVNPEGSGHFVIISHGENKLGAYSRHGNIDRPCPAGTTEEENCNWGDGYSNKGNATFISGLMRSNYDDMMIYSSYSLTEIWSFSTDGQDVYNLNEGNVGVGLDSAVMPGEKLDVDGELRVAQSLSVDKLCDRNGADSDCWGPELIGGDVGLMCDDGAPGTVTPMTGISKKAQKCGAPIAAPNIVLPATCPGAKEFIKGFDISTGLPICEEM